MADAVDREGIALGTVQNHKIVEDVPVILSYQLLMSGGGLMMSPGVSNVLSVEGCGRWKCRYGLDHAECQMPVWGHRRGL